MSRVLSFLVGTAFGIYLDQQYKLPDAISVYNDKVKPLLNMVEKKDDDSGRK